MVCNGSLLGISGCFGLLGTLWSLLKEFEDKSISKLILSLRWIRYIYRTEVALLLALVGQRALFLLWLSVRTVFGTGICVHSLTCFSCVCLPLLSATMDQVALTLYVSLTMSLSPARENSPWQDTEKVFVWLNLAHLENRRECHYYKTFNLHHIFKLFFAVQHIHRFL